MVDDGALLGGQGRAPADVAGEIRVRFLVGGTLLRGAVAGVGLVLRQQALDRLAVELGALGLAIGPEATLRCTLAGSGALGLEAISRGAAALVAVGLYHARQRAGTIGVLVRVLAGVALGLVGITLIFYIFPVLYFGRGFFAYAAFLSILMNRADMVIAYHLAGSVIGDILVLEHQGVA